ncbi:hypothetical protein [Pseudotamlana agarivorans]|uniref:hypothetical protein n=1 Tax=Pseudotamlana agarivorans TaxID=481183 RepID=UPI000835291C|nr:hypothetical protein [Tamlana agarivorans]
MDKKGDDTSSFYTIYKDKDYSKDSVFVFRTEYGLNQKEKLNLLNKQGLFDKKIKSFSKYEIQKSLNTKYVIRIQRN